MRKKIRLLLILTAAVFILSMAAFADGDDAPKAEGNDVSAKGSSEETLVIEPGSLVYDFYLNGETMIGKSKEEIAVLLYGPIENILNIRYRIQSPSNPTLYAVATSEELGITSAGGGLDEAYEKATIPEGSLLARYKYAKDLQTHPIELESKVEYEEDRIRAWFEGVLAGWSDEPVNASVSSLSGDLVITPGQNGHTYSLGDGIYFLFEDLRNLSVPEESYYFIEAEEETIEPELTTQQAEAYSIIGSYTTFYTKPETEVAFNREQNLRTSIENMNGHTFADGEEISALTMYGPVDYEHGFRDAGTIENGTHVDRIGGGICQTTTTLYNACLYAELEIVFRDHHSMPVTYVTPSRDAMVYAAGNQDFKARNNTGNPITIESFIDTERCCITVNLLGIENHDSGHSVDYESEILTMSLPTIDSTIDPEMTIGWGANKIEMTANDGPTPNMTSRLWKLTYENGELVSRDLFSKGTDKYKGQASAFAHAADTVLEFTLDGELSDGYIIVNAYFLNGVSFSDNLQKWEDEDIIAFNDEMIQLIEEYNLINGTEYVWPDEGRHVTVDGKDLVPLPTPEETPTDPE